MLFCGFWGISFGDGKCFEKNCIQIGFMKVAPDSHFMSLSRGKPQEND